MTLIAQISDPHIRLDEEDADARATLAAAVREVARLDPAPDAVLLTGDLTNTGDPAEYAVVRELLEPLAMPVHPLPGNHDEPAALRAAFADHPDVAATTGAVHYGVDIGDLHVLVLDTWAPGTDAGTLDAGQLEWLDGALAGVGNPERTLIAMHHPPIAIGIGALDTIGVDPESLAAFAEILHRRGGVARIVAGHVHRSVTGTFAGCPVFAAVERGVPVRARSSPRKPGLRAGAGRAGRDRAARPRAGPAARLARAPGHRLKCAITGAMRLATLLAVLAAATLALALPAGASAKTIWLCKPGIAKNPCAPGLKTSVVSPTSGKTLRTYQPKAATNKRVDCFYVYPTVSDQKGLTAIRRIDPEERSIARFQAARYGQDCRVFAPMYRQVTLRGIGADAAKVTAAMQRKGYDDVVAAWKLYLKKYNHGHGVIFIGHSQGSFVLRQFLAKQIDPSAAMRAKLRLRAAARRQRARQEGPEQRR